MPRKKSGDDEIPRRRRNTAAAAEPERGLLLRILLHSPKDMVAGLIAFSACSAIIANALFLQSGPHPAPMFGSVVSPPTALIQNPLPRPRPAEADATSPEPKASESRLLDPRPVAPRPVEPKAADPRSSDPKVTDQRDADPLANLVKATTSTPLPPANVLRPPAPIPGPVASGPRRVAAVQRTLTEYGYGQLKPTGTLGPDTRIAIEKFERDRRLPVTGQVSERLVRELAAMIGHPIE